MQIVDRVEGLIAEHEELFRSIIAESLAALVVDGVHTVIEELSDDVPEMVARSLARHAERFADSVCRREQGIAVHVNPAERRMIQEYLTAGSSWRWVDDPKCSRGELRLEISSGTVLIRWGNPTKNSVELRRDRGGESKE
jgi:hypothetical protein